MRYCWDSAVGVETPDTIMKPWPLIAKSVGEAETVSRPCLSTTCWGADCTPPGECLVMTVVAVTKLEKRALVSLYPVVFTLVMLSANIPMACAWAPRPDTPENRAPKILIVASPSNPPCG